MTSKRKIIGKKITETYNHFQIPKNYSPLDSPRSRLYCQYLSLLYSRLMCYPCFLPAVDILYNSPSPLWTLRPHQLPANPQHPLGTVKRRPHRQLGLLSLHLGHMGSCFQLNNKQGCMLCSFVVAVSRNAAGQH